MSATPLAQGTGAPAFGSRRERREFEKAATAAVETQAPVETQTAIETAVGAPVEIEVAPAVLEAPVAVAGAVLEVPVAVAAAAAVAAPPAEPAVRLRHRAPRVREARRPPLMQSKRHNAHQVREAELSRRSRIRRFWARGIVIFAASGLLGTAALPAYASPEENSNQVTLADAQTLVVGGKVSPTSTARDGYSVTENPILLDSTVGVTVLPTVQAAAQNLMVAVAQGRLVGSTPNHIPEIQYLAEGRVVPGCGIDYRVLQTIQVALANFGQVGVSDINRRCTGQIEGAGSASSHYANGGGHAVDFYLLDGQALSGGDSQSMKLIRILDPIVPSHTNVGQAECRSSISLTNFTEFSDTCNHLHIDFGDAQGTTLKD